MIRWCYTHSVGWYALVHTEMKQDGRECNDLPPDEERELGTES